MDLPSFPPGPASGRGPEVGPRFCPRCGRVGLVESNLCRDCGDKLLPQGYCAVCEAHWALAPGIACPKHDLALAELAPVPIEGRSAVNDQAWVTVGSFLDALRAEAPRIRLEAEGIPTFLEGE